ncbi:uncharacterized protein si:dkey-192k22.2 isoform X2 [Neoarius graeffei]|uniref:uncharacterized protein si:dkey-192k22.2 isoform X2 n=1 Tax=Neoarius graeffei TaxID=443677 RepID=UPI00298CD43E|nr:uncharacterized protein si:dkey-192k22.2 isoform X2 [Neoarius graeffei]
MMKTTVAKLAILIFLAFIVCLPEFFPSQVLQVQFLCAPFDPCDANSGHDDYDRQAYEMYDSAGLTRPLCEAKNSTSQDEAVKEWFVCETHTDLRSLHDNVSISEIDMEVSVRLQVAAPPLLQNVTVSGHFNYSGLHIETQDNITLFGCCIQKDSTQQNKDKTPQSSSSTQTSVSDQPNISEPGIFSAGSLDATSSEGKKSSSHHIHQSNRSHCLFHFKDIQRTSSKTVIQWSVITIVWLVLVVMVIVLVLLGVRDQVFKNRHCNKKKVIPILPPANQPKTFSNRRVKYKELFLDKRPSDYSRGHATSHQKHSLASTKRFLQVFQESYQRVLSPIPELSATDVSLGENEDECDEEAMSDDVITEDEFEMCLDVPLTPANTHLENFTFLHHRSHPSVESCY